MSNDRTAFVCFPHFTEDFGQSNDYGAKQTVCTIPTVDRRISFCENVSVKNFLSPGRFCILVQPIVFTNSTNLFE